MSSFFIGVDIGGTFTDCVAVRDDGHMTTSKTLSTHATTPADGVMTGLGLLAAEHDLTLEGLLERTERLSHGATIGTNLVVERKGAKVALIATRGHGDAILMMRGAGRTAGLPAAGLFDAHNEVTPDPIVPRRRIVEVPERVDWRGDVVAPLDEDEARRLIAEMLADGTVDAVAVALLWSFANPTHEQRIRELVQEISPGMFVSLSSEVSPRQGEFERTVAAVIDSYVGPASVRYLRDLAERLALNGLRTPLYVTQANGGVVPVDDAVRRPLQTIGSGPAGGLAGVVSVAGTAGLEHVIATDMGGTSFEVGLVVDGAPTMASQQVIDKYTFYSTHLDLRSIACGGGSIAFVDTESGGLRVGPHSAGSKPGPACYGRGIEPTVTDADVVLGLLDPDRFLGGRMQLDVEAARKAVARVGDRLGLSLEETAAGIVLINAHAAATLIRQRTIEQGLDPRDFTVFAYGGAGPLHAFAFAAELGVTRVLVPLGNGASTLSAFGSAVGDLLRSFERPISLTSPYDPAVLGPTLEQLEARTRDEMAASGVAPEEVVIECSASMRYAGQKAQELILRVPDGPVDAALCAELARSFTAEYGRLYSEAAVALFQSIEIFGLRVTARLRAQVAAPTVGAAGPASEARVRDVYWPGHGRLATDIRIGAVAPGTEVVGPAIVELAHTSVAVAPDQRLTAEPNGTLVLVMEDR